MITYDHGLTIAIWTVIMKKFIIIGLIFIFLGAAAGLLSPLFSGENVFASGFFFPIQGIQVTDPLALLVLGIGIIGLARLGRRKLLRP